MTMKKTSAKALLLAYLKEKGISARNTKVGVNFQQEGWNFLLWHDANDPQFFRLALPGIFDVTDATYASALMACNSVNWNYKVVKASLYEFEEGGAMHASVWVCYEQMLDATSSLEVVDRAMIALLEAAERFQILVER